jgi:hypothetical protein
MRKPIVGEVIKDLGWILEIGNEDGTDPFWGEEPYIRFLGWNDCYHGACSSVMREINEDDVCTQKEREQFFDRAREGLQESISYLKQDLDLVNKEQIKRYGE